MQVIRNKTRQTRLDYQQREGRNIPIAEVARAVGISRTAMSTIEANKTQPSYETLVALCVYYGVTPGDLLEIVEIEDRKTRYAGALSLAAA